ncbi:hypothetical protein LDE05_10970 [Lactobacillus delbrueckii subsp. bulgaricus]|uniref:Hypothetical membrane protein n=1 Tax=Lactobacillus delbrueckii subsp. bulgaricus (strain ATCC 11842 / DSM 20081 / BCRC 10696 / JCM 1002 / NBRC 13953 / NCIMB 11778 / NCTC 12712 / WDCM 00102 / Lb 14) TaxID=390333 RepID=Q1G7W9_LACDA|nr:hypothetical protein [Lactobacillus delbrueckii]MDG9748011.1 hypothetical protein [Lactobacillus delbrueckii subsp. bulgaricus ATCC 11842 = JCM 1002]GEB91234.1 hypothetical protein LDE05_10970 [Lactobacillus delbrueckii subsp. bulgaricus]CAI96881.1 Hypothetical membrane protein [Lactobacillus delbrueckii subsp. bulgaricus ATCC 11842 = JCM 1002]
MLEKYFTWLAEVLLIIVVGVGLVFITLHSLYYSYGMMIFGEHSAAATEMFWESEKIWSSIYTVAVIVIAVSTQIVRSFKSSKK